MPKSAARPLCAAPFTAVLIDTDKGIRPCCSYGEYGEHLPGSHGMARLVEGGPSVKEVMEGPLWREVQDALGRGDVPPGCKTCIERERETGRALRHFYDDPDWEQGITLLEINSSNICTLQCRHCWGLYSHRWAKLQNIEMFKPDNALLLRSLEELDLSRLKRVMFKGGEPMVNSDVPAVLGYLESIGRLPEIEINMVSNGTVVRDDMLEWFAKARACRISLSVDGAGDVQTYIRHGNSSLENVEAFVHAFSAVPGMQFTLVCSIMIYNVFSLENIRQWWAGLSEQAAGKLAPIEFDRFVSYPEHLSPRCLADETRARLAEHYRELDPKLYANVLRTLQLPFAGVETHDRFVRETFATDRLLGRSVRDAAPELADELVFLDPDAELARIRGEREAGKLEEADASLRVLAECTTAKVEWALEEARIRIDQKRFAQALEIARRAWEVRDTANDAEAMSADLAAVLVEVHTGLGDSEAARRAAEESWRRRPDDPRSCLALAGARLRAGRHDEAIELARRARDQSVDSQGHHALLARVLELQALTAAGGSVEGGPRAQLCGELVAAAHRAAESERLAPALELGSAALALIDGDPDIDQRPVWDIVTNVQARMARFDEALEVVDGAIAAMPADPDLRVRRGWILARAGRAADALSLASELEREWPDHARQLRSAASV